MDLALEILLDGHVLEATPLHPQLVSLFAEMASELDLKYVMTE